MASFPHCDSDVLHAPEDNCIYCNQHPELQEERVRLGINFTGHGPDPATERRPLDRINLWGGNVIMTPERQQEAKREWRRSVNNMLSHGALPYGDVEVECDRCEERVNGWYDERATSGFYMLAPEKPRDYPWASFFRPGEIVICDECMWKDAGYMHVYGRHISTTLRQ